MYSMNNQPWPSCFSNEYPQKLVDDTEVADNGFIFCKICQRSYVDSIEIEHKLDCEAKYAKIYDQVLSNFLEPLDKTAQQQKKGKKQNLDLQKHCGVTISPSGMPCLRSLACKSHSLASKRAVIGREKDFDLLLENYMKTHPSRSKQAKESQSQSQEDGGTPASQDTAQAPEPIKKGAKTKEKVLAVPVTTPTIIIKDGTFHFDDFGPLVAPSTKSSAMLLSKVRLSNWLLEPLKLYSRSRASQKGNL